MADVAEEDDECVEDFVVDALGERMDLAVGVSQLLQLLWLRHWSHWLI